MKISDLLDTELLATEYTQGYVNAQRHPKLPLAIYNYSKKCVYESRWNDATKKCRGLIIDVDTLEVVARPFEKFFEVRSEDFVDIQGNPDHLWGPDTPVEVVDKIDGSLGILYPDPSQPSGWAIATRGSFTSPQAVRGTEILQSYYDDNNPIVFENGFTHLFEIVYPENRIVVDYFSNSSLYYLGAVGIATGDIRSSRSVYWNARPVLYSINTYGDFLRQWKSYQGALSTEGFVVRNLLTNELRKFKTDEYKQLFRFVHQLDAVRVWEMLKDQKQIDRELKEKLPVHVQTWIYDTQNALVRRFMNVHKEITVFFEDHRRPVDRKQFAAAVHAYAPKSLWHLLFKRYDNTLTNEDIWKVVKPSTNLIPTLPEE